MSTDFERSSTTLGQIADTGLVMKAVHRAVGRAMLEHKHLGQPIVGMRDGRIVWVAPEDIEVPADLALAE